MKYPLLNQKVALITGAGRGIGQAAALIFAQAGAKVVLAARSAVEIEQVAQTIVEQGGQALAVPTDVSQADQIEALLARTHHTFGPVDILVNNAATIQGLGLTWETSPQVWQQVFNINVFGTYLMARAVLPDMLAQGTGRVINISSGVAVSNVAGIGAYSASKAALERFSGVLALEVAPYAGIVVTALRPGVVESAMQTEIRQTSTDQLPLVGRWQQLHAQGQLRPATEPATAILWLASEFAQAVNGQIFNLDDLAFRQQIAHDLEIPLMAGRER